MDPPVNQPSSRQPVSGRRGTAWRDALLLTALAAALRVVFVHMPIQCDEAAAYMRYVADARRPIADYLTHYALPNHHGLHELAVILLHRLCGAGYPWLRLPALLAGVAAVPMAYLLAWRLHGRAAGLLTAALLAGSTWAVEYSWNARGHSTALLLVTLAACLVSGSGPTVRRRAGIAAGVLLGLACYTVPTSLYVLPGLLLAALVCEPRQRRARVQTLARVAALAGLTLGLTLLPLGVSGDWARMLDNQFVRPLSWELLLRGLPDWAAGMLDLASAGAAPAGLLAIGAALGLATRTRAARWPALVWLGVLPTLLVQRVLPPPRTLLFMLPFVYASAAIGAVELWRGVASRRPAWPAALPRIGVALLIGLICLPAALYAARYPRPWPTRNDWLADLSAVSGVVVASTAPDEPVVAQEGLIPVLRYHLARQGRPRQPVVRQLAHGARGVLVWQPDSGLSPPTGASLGGCDRGPVLFATAEYEVLRVSPAALAVRP
ncbi:MAG: glycosyltransferase family 39 protein [Phycisphaerae bacterium]